MNFHSLISIDLAYRISVCMLLLSTFIAAFELLKIPDLYIDFVFLSTNMKNKKTKWILIHSGLIILIFITLFFFIWGNSIGYKIFFVLLTTLNFYSYIKRKSGKDGSDQLRNLTLLSFSFCFLLEYEIGQLVSLCFIAFQVIIAYATSGIAKITSRYWRKGDVLSGVLGTYSYGIPKISKMLSKNPNTEKIMCYSAIFAMIAVPLSFLLPYQAPLLITLGIMFCFHFSTSILMGLNDFLYTFPIAYPGILILHSLIFNLWT